ncbi:hypothetical protein GGI42DRAFT_235612 [Trichoderma sp. SZMC 28013]
MTVQSSRAVRVLPDRGEMRDEGLPASPNQQGEICSMMHEQHPNPLYIPRLPTLAHAPQALLGARRAWLRPLMVWKQPWNIRGPKWWSASSRHAGPKPCKSCQKTKAFPFHRRWRVPAGGIADLLLLYSVGAYLFLPWQDRQTIGVVGAMA